MVKNSTISDVMAINIADSVRKPTVKILDFNKNINELNLPYKKSV
jgi:hypothetical protein